MTARVARPSLNRRVAIAAAVGLTIIAGTLFAASPADDKKLSADELVTRHLAEIGSPEARAAIKTRTINGAVRVINRIGRASNIVGNATIVSMASRFRYTMLFPVVEYPSEQMAFDGERPAISYLPNGNPTNLGQFLKQQNLPLKEGLLCGVLSTAWPLMRVAEEQPKLEYKGLKKVDARELHELSYRPRKGYTDLKVMLYFDPATFRHVRSTYRFEIPARLGVGPNDSNRLTESYYLLSEDFDDFRQIDGVTLPTTYKLQLNLSTPSGSQLTDWTLQVTSVSHNQAMDERVFKLVSAIGRGVGVARRASSGFGGS
ncbi:MAG TPA: hypothetical protein VJH03_07325 [Blastocatellia bacterium]|nr:hypothetical protein [Blastocatellia bacterium]